MKVFLQNSSLSYSYRPKCKLCNKDASLEYAVSICEKCEEGHYNEYNHFSPACCEMCGDSSDEYEYHQNLYVCGEECLNLIILKYGSELFNHLR